MLKNSLYARILAGAAGVALMLPAAPVSAAPEVAKTATQGTDVALEDGNLTGKILTSNGEPVDGAVVTLSKDGKEVGRTITKADGAYTIGGLNTGSYVLVTANGPVPVRLWSKAAAPTSAKTQLTVSQTAVRGASGGSNFTFMNQGMGGPINMVPILTTGAIIGASTFGIIQYQEAQDLQDELDELQTP